MGDDGTAGNRRTGVPAGRLLGVPVRISAAWAGVLVVVAVLYPGVAARLVPGIDRLGAHLMAGGMAVLLLVSLLMHELGHVAACRIARVAVRGVVLSLPGGSVEHDDPDTPRQAAIVAVGGPAASLLLSGLCTALAALSADGGAVTALLGATAVINLAVTAFTLLPGLPMDGGELVRAAVWAWSGSPATGRRVAGRAGRVLAILIAVSPLPLTRTGDPAGSAVVLAAGLLVAAYVWHGAGTAPAVRGAATGRGIRTWLLAGAVSVAAMLLVRGFVVQSLVVASGSMDPALRTGDHIVVDKLSYRLGGIQRGDVVVLHRPSGVDAQEDVLVKRVLGVPGDQLEAREGRVFRNGVELAEPYLAPGCEDAAAGLKPVLVPDRTVYLLGDNRCDSLDSRAFGPVDQGLVQGRAVAVIWPLDHLGAIPG